MKIKLVNNLKKAVAPVMLASTLGAGIGGYMVTMPASVMAAEVVTGSFSAKLTEARNTAGLTVNVVERAVEVDDSMEGQQLVDIETNKLAAAISTQMINNTNYENHLDTVLKRTTVEVFSYKFVQKAIFTHKCNDKTIATDTTVKGNSGEAIPTTAVGAAMNALYNKGYDTSYSLPSNIKFDNDCDKDQSYNITYTEHTEKITSKTPKEKDAATGRSEVKYPAGLSKADLENSVTRTIKYQYEDGSEAFPDVVQKATVTRDATFNYVTDKVTYTDWTTATLPSVNSPEKENYTVDKSNVAGVTVTKDTKSSTVIVTYKKIPQKGSVSFVDNTGKELAEKKILNGYQTEPFNYSPEETIKAIINKGYDVINNNFPYDKPEFDTDTTRDQDYEVIFAAHVEIITADKPHKEGDATDRSEVKYPAGLDEADLNKTITRTVKFVDEDGKEMSKPVVQEAKLTRTATFNYITGEIKYSEWTSGEFDGVDVPVIENYEREPETVESMKVTSDTESSEITVTYKKIAQRCVVRFANGSVDGAKDIIEPVTLDGFNAEKIDYDPAETIEELKAKGYDFVSSTFPEKEDDRVYDTDTTVDQEFIIVMNEHTEEFDRDHTVKAGTETGVGDIKYPEGLEKADFLKEFKRVIYFKFSDENRTKHPEYQEGEIERKAVFNFATGEVTYTDWSAFTIEDFEVPAIEGYSADKEKVEGIELKEDTELEDVTVTYTPEKKEKEEETTPATTEPTTTSKCNDCKNMDEKEAVDARQGKYSDAPKTGDKAPFAALLSVMGGALATILTTIGIRKKKAGKQ